MWISGALRSLLGFHVALDPAGLLFFGLSCIAGREKVKCEQYGPLGDRSRELQSYLSYIREK